MRGADWANAQLTEFTRVAKHEHWSVERQLSMALAFVAGKQLGPQLGTYAAATVDEARTREHLLDDHDYAHVESASSVIHHDDHEHRTDLTHRHDGES